MTSRTKKVLVDVREPDEYSSGHANGAINLPLSDLSRDSKKLEDIPKDAQLVLYCRTGRRSGLAVEFFRQLGYKDVINGTNQEEIKKHFS